MINLGLSLVGQLLGSVTPAGLLGPGSTAWVWLDPSDLSTLFQDAAGTTPVTAPAQPDRVNIVVGMDGLAALKAMGLVVKNEESEE